jgi:MFS family permease
MIFIATCFQCVGAAVGPLLAGPVASASKEAGWKYVFIMLMVSDVIALIVRRHKNILHTV